MVLRHLLQEVEDLERVVTLLQKQDSLDIKTFYSECRFHLIWPGKTVGEKSPIGGQAFISCKRYLIFRDKCREATNTFDRRHSYVHHIILIVPRPPAGHQWDPPELLLGESSWCAQQNDRAPVLLSEWDCLASGDLQPQPHYLHRSPVQEPGCSLTLDLNLSSQARHSRHYPPCILGLGCKNLQ